MNNSNLDSHLTTEYTKLAQASGTALFQKGDRIYAAKQPSTWVFTTLFIVGLLTLILGGNGLGLTIAKLIGSEGLQDSSWLFGLIPLALGILSGIGAWKLYQYKKRVASLPFDQLTCICIFNLEDKTLLNAKGDTLARLTDIRWAKKMQLTSSSPTLVLSYPPSKDKIIIVKGNPFGGGIKPIQNELRRLGF
ncbi:MAG: hypothetical protein GY810_24940 [Aureispira sp.]|nr:hypothetical protein [Aureispira sp.]